MRLPTGEALRVDALRTDAYIKSLIAGGAAGGGRPASAAARPEIAGRAGARALAGAGAAAAAEPRVEPTGAAATVADVPPPDPEVASVVRLLHATAWRPHPSFRFEERVARRLAAAARGRLAPDDVAAGALVAFPVAASAVVPAARPGVPLAGIASAAIASAALSIGAAAVVAWRRGRPRRGIA